MNKFSRGEGLTLIELLITLAVIAIVFAIAVPVFSNVLAGAQASASAAQAAALASFNEEYASTDLAFANGVTTATLNGVQIASIKGDATGGASAPGFQTFGTAAEKIAAAGATLISADNVNGQYASWDATHPFLTITGQGLAWYSDSIVGAPGPSFASASEIQAAIDANDGWSSYIASNYNVSAAAQGDVTSSYMGMAANHHYNVDADGNVIAHN